MGFDIDIGIEMAKALGVKPVFVDTIWPSIIPALNWAGSTSFSAACPSPSHARKKLILPIPL
jgi:hypothetical protein